jgi:hypothetical protein
MGGTLVREERKREVWPGRWRELRKERKEEVERDGLGWWISRYEKMSKATQRNKTGEPMRQHWQGEGDRLEKRLGMRNPGEELELLWTLEKEIESNGSLRENDPNEGKGGATKKMREVGRM